MRHLYKFRHLLFIIIAVVAGCVVWSTFLKAKWCKPAETYADNFIIEILAGALVGIVPLIGAYIFGKYSKELEFHNNVEKVLQSLRSMREKEIVDSHAVRHIVILISRNFGEKSVMDKFAKKKRILPKAGTTGEKLERPKCKVCNMHADTIVSGLKEKCKYCRINSYAWDLRRDSEDAAELDMLESKVKEKRRDL